MIHPPTDDPVVIIQHEAAAHAGTLLETLVNAGLTVDVRQLHAGARRARPSRSSARSAALVVLGGSMNADQAAEFPFIDRERRLLAAAVEAGLPVLGICLGGQQLAAAIGGRVYPRAVPEVGWLPVEIVRQDGLLRDICSPFSALEWHAQSFTVPAEAEVLALRPGDPGVQAFRVGRRAWGVQFHAEVDESILRFWLRRDNKGVARRDPRAARPARRRRAAGRAPTRGCSAASSSRTSWPRSRPPGRCARPAAACAASPECRGRRETRPGP